MAILPGRAQLGADAPGLYRCVGVTLQQAERNSKRNDRCVHIHKVRVTVEDSFKRAPCFFRRLVVTHVHNGAGTGMSVAKAGQFNVKIWHTDPKTSAEVFDYDSQTALAARRDVRPWRRRSSCSDGDDDRHGRRVAHSARARPLAGRTGADLQVHMLDDNIDSPNCCRPEHARPPASMASR